MRTEKSPCPQAAVARVALFRRETSPRAVSTPNRMPMTPAMRVRKPVVGKTVITE